MPKTLSVRLSRPIRVSGIEVRTLRLRTPTPEAIETLHAPADLGDLRIGQLPGLLAPFAGIGVDEAGQIALADYPRLSQAIVRLFKARGQ